MRVYVSQTDCYRQAYSHGEDNYVPREPGIDGAVGYGKDAVNLT